MTQPDAPYRAQLEAAFARIADLESQLNEANEEKNQLEARLEVESDSRRERARKEQRNRSHEWFIAVFAGPFVAWVIATLILQHAIHAALVVMATVLSGVLLSWLYGRIRRYLDARHERAVQATKARTRVRVGEASDASGDVAEGNPRVDASRRSGRG